MNARRNSRKIWLVCLLGAMLCLAGCGKKTPESTPAEPKIELGNSNNAPVITSSTEIYAPENLQIYENKDFGFTLQLPKVYASTTCGIHESDFDRYHIFNIGTRLEVWVSSYADTFDNLARTLKQEVEEKLQFSFVTINGERSLKAERRGPGMKRYGESYFFIKNREYSNEKNGKFFLF